MSTHIDIRSTFRLGEGASTPAKATFPAGRTEVKTWRGPGAEWMPWNCEAGYDYANNRYHDGAPEAGR